LLARIEHKDRLATLVATKEGSVYTFDVHLQGDRETVFLDI
jgi:protocatechuate 3,4-dioxygenase alpha subunit